MGIKTKFNPMGGISSSDKGRLGLWRYSNTVIAGKTLLYNYMGSWDIDTLYVPMVKGKSIINDWYNATSSGTTDANRNTPFYNNESVVNVDLQGVPFRNNSMFNAFYNCQNLVQINNIPNSVTNMNLTFLGCQNLNQNIQIPNSVTDMASTFEYCYNLNQNIQIPNSVTNMSGTFMFCNNLNQNIQIPNSVKSMAWTFYYCYNLNQNIQIPNSVTNMYTTFFDCSKLSSTINILSTEIANATNAFNTFDASVIAIPNVVIQSRYINNGATKTWNSLNTAGWRFTAAAESAGSLVGTSPNQVHAWGMCSDWPTYTGNGTHWVVSKWGGNLSKLFNNGSEVTDLVLHDYFNYPIALSSSCFISNSVINSIDCNHTTMISSVVNTFQNMSNLKAIWNINLNGVTQAYGITWNCQNAYAISVGTPQYRTGYLNFEDGVVNAQAQYGWCTNLSNMYVLGKGITKCFATFNHCNTRNVNIYISGAGFSNYGNWLLGWSATYKKSVTIYFQYSNGVNTPVWNTYKSNKSYYGTSGVSTSVNPMYNSTSNFYIYNMSKDFCTTNNKSWMCCPVNGAIRYTGDGYDDNTAITIPTSLSVAEFPDKNKTVTVNVQNFSNLFEGFFKMNCPITIPGGVVDMNYTFYNCQNFNQDIQIPNSVTTMNSTFYNCKNLRGKTITVLTTELTDSFGAFYLTASVKSVYIYYKYANGVNTKTYNLVVAGPTASKWHGQNGVTVYNLGKAPW